MELTGEIDAATDRGDMFTRLP